MRPKEWIGPSIQKQYSMNKSIIFYCMHQRIQTTYWVNLVHQCSSVY